MIAKSRTLALVLLFAFHLGLTGCGEKEYAKHISTFQSGVVNTTSAISSYYHELNEFERELYLQELLYDKTQKVSRFLDDNGSRKPSPLVGQTFSAKSIKARTDAIQVIGTYGKHLADLAGSDAPRRFSDASKSLVNEFNGLANTFGELSDVSSDRYKEPLGAMGTLVGFIGQSILEAKRDAALKKAIEEGAPKVRIIIDLLEKDLETVIAPLRSTGSLQAVNIAMDEYNDKREGLSFAERQSRLEEIRRLQLRYDLAVTFNPSSLMKSMRDANEALVKFAVSPKKPTNLSELITSLEVFQQRSEIVLNAVSQMKSLRRG